MPLISYICEDQHSSGSFFRHRKDITPETTCKKCGKIAKRQLKGPASRSILVVDNGIQGRATEVDMEMVEDIETRSIKDFKEK